MADRLSVTHLYDDSTAGGVMRVLDHIEHDPGMADLAKHKFVHVSRGAIRLTRYDSDVIVSHLAVSWRTLPAFAALRAANPRARLIHVEHSYTEAFVALNVTHQGRFCALLRNAFRLFDTVVAVSQGQGEWLRATRLCPARKLAVIQSCVDLSGFAGLAAPRMPAKVFGAIGRLDRQKGFDELIHAFRATADPQAALHIFGTGPDKPMLEALAAGDGRIRFLGFVPDPRLAFANVDAVVVPSRWEAYGLVAIEALAAGRTVFCANVDGLRDHEAYGARMFDAQSLTDFGAFLEDAPRNSYLNADATAEKLQHQFVENWRGVLTKSDAR